MRDRETLPDPVILVPGITASYLRDDYPLPPEHIWTVLTKDFDRAATHPDDRRFEAREPAQVRAGQVYEIAYRELIEELRFNLPRAAETPVPVHAFGYDWRQPLEVVQAELAALVDEVIDRTRLLRHYDRDGFAEEPRVNLVGHSMGGLIIAGYLAERGGAARVGKVATIATPFQGSFEAVIKVTTGTANLGTAPPSSREREAARMTPALYYLMPSFDRGLRVDGQPSDAARLFDPALWQSSVIDTITTYVRRYGLDPAAAEAQAPRIFAALLDAARAHRERIDALDLAAAGLEAARDWLCLIGADSTTRVRLDVVHDDQGRPDFAFHSEDRANHWRDGETPEDRRATGDGTVPFEGALPPFLEAAGLVCLTPDDFGYWEIQDKLTAKAAGFHGILPNMNLVHRLIVRHLTGRPDRHGNTWGRPAPGVADWTPPFPMRQR